MSSPFVIGSRYPVLESERLVLRFARRGDYRAWADARRANADFLKPWEPRWGARDVSQEAYHLRLKQTRQEFKAGRAYPFLLVRKNSNTILGGLTLAHIRRGAAQSGEIGYWLTQDAQGNGYMQEALGRLIGYAFNEARLERLVAACLPENQRSIALVKRLGFQYEGIGRDYLEIAGQRRDHELYALIRADLKRKAEG